MSEIHTPHRLFTSIVLLLVLALGIWLRLPDDRARARKGADEGYYERYVTELDRIGVIAWPDLIAGYIERQKGEVHAFLPPTRVLFLASAVGWRAVTGASPIEAVRNVSCTAGILTLCLGAAIFWRLSQPPMALAATLLLACSPLLIHLSHRALIDGFFALWSTVTLWGLWESMRAPATRSWLAVYALGLGAMVLTKENAAFVFVALCGILVLNRWLQIGTVTCEIIVVTLLAPALAAAILTLCAGGLPPLIEAYRLNVQKSIGLPYAIATGDGPWHRYLLDFLLVSPAVTVLALGSIGATPWSDPTKRYFIVFIAISYALMAKVRYGMNMRYGAIWVVPVCWLAASTIIALTNKVTERWRTAAMVSAIGIAAALELQSYGRLFGESKVYDPVAGALTQQLGVWKK